MRWVAPARRALGALHAVLFVAFAAWAVGLMFPVAWAGALVGVMLRPVWLVAGGGLWATLLLERAQPLVALVLVAAWEGALAVSLISQRRRAPRLALALLVASLVAGLVAALAKPSPLLIAMALALPTLAQAGVVSLGLKRPAA